ncbi:MAG: threonine--tRNA ligase [Methanophagales archaeon]|nr:threonine--tRNA ligase [Methanophagales archaeon]MCW3139051.1 threonine--tRNA ligase [Methanophagales archaeon]MCW7069441.1 threonine--tRNA ligase [Methanophagales archaeon]
MQLLFIHSDFIEYEARDKTRVAEEIENRSARVRVEEALVVFIAVERGDGDEYNSNSEYVVEKATEEVISVAKKVGAERIVLYPYAHLSSELASPEISMEILKAMEEQLRARGMEVKRAPFGWYKAFTIRCKGHPLSELSRKIKVGEEEKRASKALEAEEKAESDFFFMDERGELIAPSNFKFGDADEKLKKFFLYESEKRREVDKIPPHVELMKRLEIADYEPSSDPGNMRFYPRGELIKKLIEDYVREAVTGYGAAEVETPLMYSVKHPSLKDYIDRFPARQYSILGKDNKPDLFLRFSACFGQFLMSKDMSISYKSLPLKLFELAYSFRKEKRGELVGLRRLRKFTMPDMHTLCRDMSEALEEFKQQYEVCMRVLADIGFSTRDYEVAIRFTRDFYEAHRDFIKELVRIAGKPVLIELWDQRFFYFVLKFEFNFVDALGKASALSTVQIDVENAARYGIRYIDARGEEKEPIILHCSPSGAIERCMYALLEKAYMDKERGTPPMLPLWLSPTQLRLIPVAERHHEYIRAILPALDGIRVDVDDREETVSKKIRDAGREWIPYVGVIGDREVERGTVNVNIRATQQVEEMAVEELRRRIAEGIKGRPYRKLPLPLRLSERVRFVG